MACDDIVSTILLQDYFIMKVSGVQYVSDLALDLESQVRDDIHHDLKLRLSTKSLIQMIETIRSNYKINIIESSITSIAKPTDTTFVYILCEKLINYQTWRIDVLGMEYSLKSILVPLIDLFINKSITFECNSKHLFELGLTNTNIDYLSVIEQYSNIKSHYTYFTSYKTYVYNINSLDNVQSLLNINSIEDSIDSELLLNNKDKYQIVPLENDDNNNNNYNVNYNTNCIQFSQPKRIRSCITLTQREVSCLIGKQGTRLNSLRQESNCIIKVLPLDNNLSTTLTSSVSITKGLARKDTPQNVLVVGNESDVKFVLKSIETIIIEYRHSDSKFI
ncbi:uncharacterized protein RJT21DRAFT_2393 [Scheffersomyces amazonensis]|uniref:uncharacterized protein n=1 Tax=Scheffersomyces amazonensis TaxID=1078765 RepID=UPI00315CC986